MIIVQEEAYENTVSLQFFIGFPPKKLFCRKFRPKQYQKKFGRTQFGSYLLQLLFLVSLVVVHVKWARNGEHNPNPEGGWPDTHSTAMGLLSAVA